jgi:hypothetical protein
MQWLEFPRIEVLDSHEEATSLGGRSDEGRSALRSGRRALLAHVAVWLVDGDCNWLRRIGSFLLETMLVGVNGGTLPLREVIEPQRAVAKRVHQRRERTHLSREKHVVLDRRLVGELDAMAETAGDGEGEREGER